MSTLEEFKTYFLSMNFRRPVIEHRDYGKLVSDVVFRYGQFQVEHVTVQPNVIVNAHRHPSQTAYEVHIRGDMIFVTGDKERLNRFLERAKPIKEHRLKGRHFLVKNTDWHGAKVGDTGATFYSIQQWVADVPLTAAGIDWEGPALEKSLAA